MIQLSSWWLSWLTAFQSQRAFGDDTPCESSQAPWRGGRSRPQTGSARGGSKARGAKTGVPTAPCSCTISPWCWCYWCYCCCCCLHSYCPRERRRAGAGSRYRCLEPSHRRCTFFYLYFFSPGGRTENRAAETNEIKILIKKGYSWYCETPTPAATNKKGWGNLTSQKKTARVTQLTWAHRYSTEEVRSIDTSNSTRVQVLRCSLVVARGPSLILIFKFNRWGAAFLQFRNFTRFSFLT